MSADLDPYTDPETGMLRNLLGARTQADLDRVEGDLSAVRLMELAERYPVRATADLAELRGIHGHLFQDVYPWAGQVRTVDIRKPGGEPFLPVSRIEVGTNFVFEELRGDNWLRGLSRPDFIERLAHHYDGLNYAHPFREGNGRAQRVFWSRDAGWRLDWRLVTRERNNEASRAAMERSDLAQLKEMFDGMTTARSGRGPGRSAVEVARLAFGAPAAAVGKYRRAPSTEPRRGQGRGRLSDRGPGIGD